MSSEKQKIINDIYLDRSGYGSKAVTLKDARAKDKSITMADVEEFFDKYVELKEKNQKATTHSLPLIIIILISWIYFLFQKMILKTYNNLGLIWL